MGWNSSEKLCDQSRKVQARIGIILGTKPQSGGGRTYEKTLVDLARRAVIGHDARLLFFHLDPSHGLREVKGDRCDELGGFPRKSLVWRRKFPFLPKFELPSLDVQLSNRSIDLVYFASPNLAANGVTATPLVTTVWDLGHLDLPHFPEYRHSSYRLREDHYSSTLSRSFHVFSESLATSNRIVHRYGVSPSRVSSLGLPLPDLRPGSVFSVPEELEGSPYLIYPAQKWPHKNHVTVLKAMVEVVRDFPSAKLVFIGRDAGNGKIVREVTRELGLQKIVLDLGFVTDETRDGLISNAKALLMPTLLGPTNYPPLEALALGTRVIASDVHEFEEQTVNKAIIMVPSLDHMRWASEMKAAIVQDSPNPMGVSSLEAVLKISRVFESFLEHRKLWAA